MVSFSLRLRISYLLLQDSSLVSFHLIQFDPYEWRQRAAEFACGPLGRIA